MKTKLGKYWESIHTSYWFVPTLMASLAIALAFGMLTLDRSGKSGPLESLGWFYAGGPDGARTMLSTIAGSMIAVAGTVFSITVVALTLASSQFGPRILRNFMQDTGNQLVLGTFIGTFIYCLLVLRTVRGDDYNVFVPQISVTVGLFLALVSIGVLIYFIHHVSSSIQAEQIIGGIGKDLDNAIDRLFPQQIGHSAPESQQRWVEEIPVNFDKEAVPIRASGSGYLQAVDESLLMKIAQSKDLMLRLKYRPGKFIVQDSELVLVWPGDRVDRKLAQQLNQAFTLGLQRTEQQDVEFPINQLVEIAVRALSPGINDPFTAIQCIDRISAALCRLAEREFPCRYRYDDQHNLRVIADPVTLTRLIDDAFNQIRQYTKPDVAVKIRLLDAIAIITRRTCDKKGREALRRQADMIQNSSQEEVSQECDRQDIKERYLTVLKALEQQ